jgi:hypothetical protein
MVNLFFEIRRNIPQQQAQALKLAAPNLGDMMIELYQNTNDENVRLLTEIFLEKAGDDWLAKANPRKAARILEKLKLKKLLEEKSESSESSDGKDGKSKKKVSPAPRYYRGAIVED